MHTTWVIAWRPHWSWRHAWVVAWLSHRSRVIAWRAHRSLIHALVSAWRAHWSWIHAWVSSWRTHRSRVIAWWARRSHLLRLPIRLNLPVCFVLLVFRIVLTKQLGQFAVIDSGRRGDIRVSLQHLQRLFQSLDNLGQRAPSLCDVLWFAQ